MSYRPRIIEPVLQRLVADVPAVLVLGPRSVGKTTMASRYGATVVRLDEPAQATVFAADPDAALRGLAEPVLIDEWQNVPAVMGAIKRAVDDDTRPGRFLLTGSADAALDGTWPGTGRIVHLTLHGMTVRETRDAASEASFLDDLLDHPDRLLAAPTGVDLREYVDLALQSGFPEALRIDNDVSRDDWLASYLRQVIHRDVPLVDARRDPSTMQRFVEAYASSSSCVTTDATIRDAAGIDKRTAVAYERVLEDLFLVERIPAWWTNRLKRLVSMPKRVVLDPGAMAASLRVQGAEVMRDGTMLGRLLETFVIAQLRPELEVSARRPRAHHLRQQQGRHEIDLLVEIAAGVVGIEIKATSAPSIDDAAHLVWLRDQLGDAFVQGVVFHTGPRGFVLDDRILALPIASIWSRG